MHSYNTIIGVITMRQNGCTFPDIESRYRIGSSSAQLILKRYKESSMTLEQLEQMKPSSVEALFYPRENIKHKQIPEPDYQHYYNQIHTPGSKVNLAYCWIEYRKQNPNGYGQTQFYENYNKFEEEHYSSHKSVSMPVERIPGEKMYIDWVGDQPYLLVNELTGELEKVHIFATTLGVSSLIYAEVFKDEKLPQFITGTVNAIKAYGGVAKYFVPDNLKTAVKKHSKDELTLQSVFSDLEDFYDTIILPPPPRKPKGKATVEKHVNYLETHLVEKLKEKTFFSIEEINIETKKIVAELNSRNYQGESYSRLEAFNKFDKPCLKPLPGDFTVCDYKYILRIPDNYHVEYDDHYYSVFYLYCGKSAIIKATATEIRICDQYNKLICKHTRAYKPFPKYITEDSHMKSEHLYYKELNAKDGNYYRKWASAIGPNTQELIDRILKSFKHEEQAYNSCAGILFMTKDMPYGLVEEVSIQCIQMNSCTYSNFKNRLQNLKSSQSENNNVLPVHNNIRGKGYYK